MTLLAQAGNRSHLRLKLRQADADVAMKPTDGAKSRDICIRVMLVSAHDVALVLRCTGWSLSKRENRSIAVARGRICRYCQGTRESEADCSNLHDCNDVPRIPGMKLIRYSQDKQLAEYGFPRLSKPPKPCSKGR